VKSTYVKLTGNAHLVEVDSPVVPKSVASQPRQGIDSGRMTSKRVNQKSSRRITSSA